MNVEVLHDKAIRIGPREYRLYSQHEPRVGFERYTVEMHGTTTGNGEDVYDRYSLIDVYPRDFPDSFELLIYRPHFECREIGTVTFKKCGTNCSMTVTVSHSYSDWPFQTHLRTFYSELCERFKRDIPACTEATPDADEYGVSAIVQAKIDSNTSLHAHISTLTAKVGSIVKGATIDLANPNAKPKSGQLPDNLKPDDKGFKWWLRYIFVPILGAAAAAAAIYAARFVFL